MSTTPIHAPINVRAMRYFVARTSGTCRHCNQPTALLALVLPPGHETLDLDDEAQDAEAQVGAVQDKELQVEAAQAEDGAADSWSVAEQAALLFYIEYLPQSVLQRLTEFSRGYRVVQGEADTALHWANHCDRCGAPLDDEELCCEPGGAFLPFSEAEAAAIRLVSIDAVFEAGAGGYAYHPEFLHVAGRE